MKLNSTISIKFHVCILHYKLEIPKECFKLMNSNFLPNFCFYINREYFTTLILMLCRFPWIIIILTWLLSSTLSIIPNYFLYDFGQNDTYSVMDKRIAKLVYDQIMIFVYHALPILGILAMNIRLLWVRYHIQVVCY